MIWATIVTGFPGGSEVKKLPAKLETQIWSQGQQDPVEKGMVTHSSILAWEIPWREEPGELYSPWGGRESDMTEWLNDKNYRHTPGDVKQKI